MIISKMLNALILSLHILNVVNSFSISFKCKVIFLVASAVFAILHKRWAGKQWGNCIKSNGRPLVHPLSFSLFDSA
jgi:hypothetical protein